MTSQPVLDLYTRKAKFYQRFFVELLQWDNILKAFFLRNSYLHSGMKILDAGCGTGTVTHVLYNLAQQQRLENITFHGFDLTPAMLDIFREWMKEDGIHAIELRQADVMNLEGQLPQRWYGYDLIVSAAMFEYIPKEGMDQALNNLKRLLNEKGRLLLFVTKKTLITYWTGAKWWGTNLFSHDELEDRIRQAGFTNVNIKRLPGVWATYMFVLEAFA